VTAWTVKHRDALPIPAAGGVDKPPSSGGLYQRQCTAVVMKKGKTLADIKGQKINLGRTVVCNYCWPRGLYDSEM